MIELVGVARARPGRGPDRQQRSATLKMTMTTIPDTNSGTVAAVSPVERDDPVERLAGVHRGEHAAGDAERNDDDRTPARASFERVQQRR